VGYVSGLRDVSRLVYRSLVWCGAVGYVSGLRDVSRLVYRSLVWCGAVGYVSGLRDVSRLALSYGQDRASQETSCKPDT